MGESRFNALPDRQREGIADILAAAFHQTYEDFAPEYGYETRPESRKAWGEVPEQNRRLMTAVVKSLLERGLLETPVR